MKSVVELIEYCEPAYPEGQTQSFISIIPVPAVQTQLAISPQFPFGVSSQGFRS